MRPVETSRIAVLGLFLELYQQEIPGYEKETEKQLLKFQHEIGKSADIKSSRLCYLKEHVSEEIKKAEALDVDALLLIPMCYTTSMMTVPPVLQTDLPIVIWNTQEAIGFDDDYDAKVLLMNHVTQGTQDLTNVLLRNDRFFGMESGHYQDTEALKRLEEWLKAARVYRVMKSLKVGLLGHPFEGMGDFDVDETRMATDWGPLTVHLEINRFIDLIEQVNEQDISEIIKKDHEIYEIDKNLNRETHLLSVKLELALRQLIAENHLDAFTMNFKDLITDKRSQTLPFLGINKLIGEGIGYAGEGNTTIAAHVAQLRQLCDRANFTEIYTVDYQKRAMVMTHMQECNPALARKDRKVRLLKKDFWTSGVEPYTGMHFTLEPGPVTLSSITNNQDGNFFYINYETQILDMEPFEKFDIPHWVIQLDEPVEDFMNSYSLAGGTHHLAACPGHNSSIISKLAQFQNFTVKNL